MIHALLRCTLASLALAAPVAFADTLTGSGRPVTETRAVSAFTGIAFGVPGRLELTQGNLESLTITADDNVLREIETVVEDGTLRIRFAKKNTAVNRATIRIGVVAKTVERLAAGGSGNISAGALQARNLSISLGGSGRITLASVTTGDLKADIGGSGKVAIQGGSAESLSASIAGSGDLNAPRLAARRVKVNVAGSGDASVWASEALDASIAGSGRVRYYGDPKVGKSIVGSGDVRRLGASPS